MRTQIAGAEREWGGPTEGNERNQGGTEGSAGGNGQQKGTEGTGGNGRKWNRELYRPGHTELTAMADDKWTRVKWLRSPTLSIDFSDKMSQESSPAHDSEGDVLIQWSALPHVKKDPCTCKYYIHEVIGVTTELSNIDNCCYILMKPQEKAKCVVDQVKDDSSLLLTQEKSQYCCRN
eukprot:Gb_02652 [translate_table: standard]